MIRVKTSYEGLAKPDKTPPGLSDFVKFVKKNGSTFGQTRKPVNIEKDEEKLDRSENMTYHISMEIVLLIEAFNRLSLEQKKDVAEYIETLTGETGLVSQLDRQIDVQSILNPPPHKVPELYEDRKDEAETVVEFIERVYGEPGYLTGYFGRQHLRKLDKRCMRALDNWEYKHGKADHLLLPSKGQLTDILLSPSVFDHLPIEEQRRLDQLAKQRERLRLKSEPS